MSERPSPLIYACTFLLAGSVLLLEIALTRVFSVMTWHHSTHLILSIALLGFGAAGSWLTQRARKGRPQQIQGLANYATAFAVSVVLAVVAVSFIHVDPHLSARVDMGGAVDAGFLSTGFGNMLGQVVWELLLACPFFLAGVCLATVISTFHERIHGVYFADLLGASVGALLAVPALTLLGAPNVVALVACMAAVVAVMFRLEAGGRPLREGGVLTAALVVLGLGVVFQPLYIHSAPTKELWTWDMANPSVGSDGIALSEWHPVARVDITTPRTREPAIAGGNADESFFEGDRVQRAVFQDGAAPTWIFQLEGEPEDERFLSAYLQAAPYTVATAEPKVMVIGVGGGADILIALHHGARHVTGVEINPWMVRAVTETFADFTQGVFLRDDVELVISEGRHFAARDDAAYDVIQLSGVDTFSALSNGAYVLAEAHLYTVEAIDDLLDRLAPDGVLS